MPTINQLVSKPRKTRNTKKKTLAFKTRYNSLKKVIFPANSPFMKGICKKVLTIKPRKPNSANRAIARVLLANRKEISVFIPGEKHNLQEYSSVLIRGGKAKDLGISYSVVRGYGDTSGVKERKQGRSLYGTKKIKKIKKN